VQFHLDGFHPLDPSVADPAARKPMPGAEGALPDEVDVLIVGCGPAGLTLAAQLAVFPEIRTCIVDQKEGQLLRGQADGISCRSMEMFNAFGFAERIMKEGYWVNETGFWNPDEQKPKDIKRQGRIDDVEEGLSEFPHMILNQARVHEFYLETMYKSLTKLRPFYSRKMLNLNIPEDNSAPIEVHFERDVGGGTMQPETLKARYVVGCDGARSSVRKSLGRELHGDSANKAWGVMDVLAFTDFPDIRLKCVIQSAGEGSIVLIPREGGYMVRVYVEMDELRADERVAHRDISIDHIIAAAQRILHPHLFEVRDVAWWSVYEIGQRLTNKFDDVLEGAGSDRLPRVFIAGDACHTHSPKAGQGMNVSMQDAFNLGWKLASVLLGRCPPEFLHTYSAERHSVAQELIDFDREWSKMLTMPINLSGDETAEGIDPGEVQRYFVRQGKFTAGTATQYAPSLLTATADHQELATGLLVGKRFHSAPVIRLGDAKPMHLGHVALADGRWRIYAFADQQDPMEPSSKIGALCEFLATDPASPVLRYTPTGADIDSCIDVRTVFQQHHHALDLQRMPAFLLPEKGRFGLRDYEKMFCADHRHDQDIFDLRGISRADGCIVVVRPDQYIADVVPLDGFARLSNYFARLLLDQP
jgi:phenol 2-monooxygenase